MPLENKPNIMKKLVLALTLLSAFQEMKAQKEPIRTDSLNELIITSTRIDLPFKENSRTIQIVTAKDIQKLGVNNFADVLQQISGIDIRRQGVNGMQADLYIRGGGFDQTLLLIDGIKVDDPQTGHHTLNMALPVDVIKRIEIIKGPAARIFGQNAFNGAINIVTKDGNENSFSAKLQAGSFQQFLGEVVGTVTNKNSNHIIQVSKNFSEGYRENTDFDNTNVFIKSQFNKNKLPINFISSFNERKFGANGFYGIPTATEQYEETQASLVGFSTVIKKGNIIWKPRIYWRRNQDEYIYIRSNPSAYRNLHITNKIATELNGSYQSSLGITGFGLELSKYYIGSNNLGNRQREIATLFIEHRFQFLNSKLDITPGLAASYFSDFDNRVFPGLDIGYEITNNIRVYGNMGYTYRVPTYTDMYYIGPQAVGNENLNAERALAEEIGFKFDFSKINITIAGFNRDAKDLIDYVRVNETDVAFTPLNITKVNTQGIELETNYKFTLLQLPQRFQIGYTYIDDEVKNSGVAESRYSINSLKHQITSSLAMQWTKQFSTNLAYRYIERTSGYSYSVYDASANYQLQDFTLSFYANNIFNTEYTEASNLPMPKGNVLLGLKYNFK